MTFFVLMWLPASHLSLARPVSPPDAVLSPAFTLQLENALQLQQSGRLQDAERELDTLFEQTRAQLGLFDPVQFPILEQLTRLQTEQRDWSTLLKWLSYYEWLANKIHVNNPVLLAEQLQRNALLHEQAATETSGNQRSWHLIQARMLYWRAISSLQTVPDTEHLLPPLYYAIAVGHYAINRHASQRWLTSFETRSDEPALISGWSLPGSERERRSKDIGAELLDRIVAWYSRPGVNPELTAQVMVLRGDWEWLHESPIEANHFYEQSLALAGDSSCPEVLFETLMGREQLLPVPTLMLSDNPCLSSSESNSPTQQHPWNSGVHRPVLAGERHSDCNGDSCYE